MFHKESLNLSNFWAVLFLVSKTVKYYKIKSNGISFLFVMKPIEYKYVNVILRMRHSYKVQTRPD